MAFRLPKPRWMLRRKAAALLAQLQSGRDPQAERRLKKWCDADRRHARAFEHVRRSFEQAGLLRHSAIFASGHHEPPAEESRRQPRWALAASVAVVVLVPAGILLMRDGGVPLGGTDAVMLMTSIGEIKQFKLADGSTVTLDTATKVDVEIGRSHRNVHLNYGRARFQVVRADAPFTVETSGATVTTRGGVVDVEQLGERGRIAVLAGTASVSAADQHQTTSIPVREGQGVTVNSGIAVQKIALTPTPDWTRGMLQFDGTPLADAIALANRYSRQRILIDEKLHGLRVSGAFRAGDTLGLAKALAAAFRLSLRSTADGNLALSPNGASPDHE